MLWHQCGLSEVLLFDKSKAMYNVMRVYNDQCIHYRVHVTACRTTAEIVSPIRQVAGVYSAGGGTGVKIALIS